MLGRSLDGVGREGERDGDSSVFQSAKFSGELKTTILGLQNNKSEN